jgi:hypothetical protein
VIGVRFPWRESVFPQPARLTRLACLNVAASLPPELHDNEDLYKCRPLVLSGDSDAGIEPPSNAEQSTTYGNNRWLVASVRERIGAQGQPVVQAACAASSSVLPSAWGLSVAEHSVAKNCFHTGQGPPP